ncbi:hypothetical protein I315_02040 [Cryptococcus gattii Ru294]|nr:hypothetical protein I315_02040 [Cryptococcus gattii Ru294]
MAPPASTSSSSNQQPSQAAGAQGSGSPAQSPINDVFDQSDNLDFLSALTGDPQESSGPSNNNSDELRRNRANNLVKFLLRYADKDLLEQALSPGTAVHYAFHLLVRVRQRKSKKGKLVWNGAEGFDLDDWPSPPPDGNIEAEVEWRGERVQVWRPDWGHKKKNTAFFAALRSTIRDVLPSSINYDEGLVRAKIDTYRNTRQEAWYRKSSGQNSKSAAAARRRTRLKDQRDMLDSAFRTSVILPKCREYNIIQRAVNASLLVPMLYDHTDSKFQSELVLQEGEDVGTEAGYQLFPILKSLSGLRTRPDDQCWAYEEQPWWSDTLRLAFWVLKLEYQKRAIMEMFPLPAYLRSPWPSPSSMPQVSSNNTSNSNAVCPGMVNPAILAQDRYADYKSGLSDDPPLVAGKPSLRELLDLPEYRSLKERALGLLRIPRVGAGPLSVEYLGGLWRRMMDVSEEDLVSGEWDRILHEEISMHYR